MRQSAASHSMVARTLLEHGSLNEADVLEVEEPSNTYAHLIAIILLTEPTRLVVRREKDPYSSKGYLKWHIVDLVNALPIAWTIKAENVARSLVLACTRGRFVRDYHHEIHAGNSSTTVIKFRKEPPETLVKIHEILARRITEASPRLMFPGSRNQWSVPEKLVRECLLLPYDQRKQLVRTVWGQGEVSDCSPSLALLVLQVQALSVVQTKELGRMLM